MDAGEAHQGGALTRAGGAWNRPLERTVRLHPRPREVTSAPRAAGNRRPGWHPLLLAGVILVVARGTSLLLHFLSRDPNGNPVSASPLQSLVVTVPYHGAFVLSLVTALLGLWLLAPPLRRVVTPLGVALCLAAVLVGQVDLGLQWFIGQRLSPDVLTTYGGSAFLNSDVYAPSSTIEATSPWGCSSCSGRGRSWPGTRRGCGGAPRSTVRAGGW